MKYSPADQITPANVSTLTQAWTYPTGGAAPIVINNVMYFAAGPNVVALNADAGTELWKFALADATPGGAIRRGMTYWPGTPPHAPRVLVTMSAGKLVQLDAKTGKLIPDAGVIDLVSGIMNPIPGGESYTIASPVAVYKNLAIFPGRTGEHNRWGIPGDSARLRSADRQGSLALSHHPASRRSELRHVGPERMAGPQGSGLVAAADRRHRKRSGVRRARQRRRSELRQQPSGIEPLLRQRRRARRGDRQVQVALPDRASRHLRRGPERPADVRGSEHGTASAFPAIVQGTKPGLLFFLNRLTGEPIFGVEERPVPPSDALGDAAWPTQPFPVKPEPITRLSMTRAEVSKISPEAEKYCTEIYDQAVQMGPYTPYGMVPEHLLPRLDRRRQQPRQLVRSRPRHGVRDRAQRRHHRPALRDAVVRRAAVVRQDEDAVRLLPRSRRLPVQRAAVGGAVRHQRQHRRHRLARAARRIQGAGGEGHSRRPARRRTTARPSPRPAASSSSAARRTASSARSTR